jgi:hypothetical protein
MNRSAAAAVVYLVAGTVGLVVAKGNKTMCSRSGDSSLCPRWPSVGSLAAPVGQRWLPGYCFPGSCC